MTSAHRTTPLPTLISSNLLHHTLRFAFDTTGATSRVLGEWPQRFQNVLPAMTLCNACDSRQTVANDPRGYCKECGQGSTPFNPSHGGPTQ